MRLFFVLPGRQSVRPDQPGSVHFFTANGIIRNFLLNLRRKEKGITFAVRFCGYGVIGSRAGLRIRCRKACGFESLYPHFTYRAEKL